MPSKKLVKTEQIESLETLENTVDCESDGELEAPVIMQSVKQVKEKRKLNLTEDERERRRQVMLKVREKKMENSQKRNLEKDLYLQKQEEEINEKVLKKAELMRKRKEKEVLQNLIRQEISKTQPRPNTQQTVHQHQPAQVQPLQPQIRFI